VSAAKHTPTQGIDPRGIHQKQTRVLVDPNGGTTLVQFECGHISEMAQHFTYKIGDVRFCFKCGKEAKARNSHDELAAALDACRLRLMEHIEQSGCRADHEAFDMATAALSRASHADGAL
jgi:hypothetical protein